MRKNILLLLIIGILSGCGLSPRNDFTEDMVTANDVHSQELTRWLKNKGVTETSLIGSTPSQVRAKLGKPSKIFYDKDRGACLDKARQGLVLGEECSGEEWIYSNWYSFPHVGGFASYTVCFQKGVAVISFGYKKDG